MDDREFLAQFLNTALPFSQWTHRAHIKVAYLIVRDYPFPEALERTRLAIKAYNAAHNVPETPSTGYNETTTVAFLTIIASTMAAYGDLFPVQSADEFCDLHTHLLNKHLLRLFYSPERRGHPDAKHFFVEPDLTPLPRILSR